MDPEQSQPSQDQLRQLAAIIDALPNVKEPYGELDPSVRQVADFFKSLSPEERKVLANTADAMKKAGMAHPLEKGLIVCFL